MEKKACPNGTVIIDRLAEHPGIRSFTREIGRRVADGRQQRFKANNNRGLFLGPARGLHWPQSSPPQSNSRVLR